MVKHYKSIVSIGFFFGHFLSPHFYHTETIVPKSMRKIEKNIDKIDTSGTRIHDRVLY
jgi:hypothetical protein